MNNNNHVATAEIVAIGTEILLGELTDTNSVFIARQLRDIGVNVFFMSSVGDNISRIADVVKIALQRSNIVITCGGLGPTVDDMTRQGIAQVIDQPLQYHPELFEAIQARFVSYRVQMTENNRRQAYLPAGATPIPNPVGTAPAFYVDVGGKLIISLPGVPRELKYLVSTVITPFLQSRFSPAIIKARVLKTAGIGESSLDDLIGDELLNSPNPSIGLAAHHGTIDIRLTAKASTEQQADEMLEAMVARVYKRVGEFVFGEGKITIEEALANELTRQESSLIVVSAGIEVEALGNIPPGTIMYVHHPTLEELERALQLTSSLALRELALTAAEESRKIYQVDIAVVLVSVPEVDESPDSNDATAIAVVSSDFNSSRAYGFGGRSLLAQEWGPRWAFAQAWRFVSKRQPNA